MRLGAIVLDCADPQSLGAFYQNLLGWELETQVVNGDTWCIVAPAGGGSTPLVFQQVADYRPPTWPGAPGQQQQQLHLDFYVGHDEGEAAVARALACGARRAEQQLSPDWTVLLDPAGHPFCVIPIPEQFAAEGGTL